MHTLILGFDAFDPGIFERLAGQGKLPNLARYAEAGGYARFEVANPPQSEVSWTSIATGLNPGEHGIFDFVHRDPATYTPYLSLLPTRRGPGGTRFVPPHTAVTIFEEATQQGYPATSLWWPATFPARPELAVRTIPGLGTPDIRGRLGVGTAFCADAGAAGHKGKTQVVRLERQGRDRYRGLLGGPLRGSRSGGRQSFIELQLAVVDGGSARLVAGRNDVELALGEWSPIIELRFAMGPFVGVHALTRVILTQTQPDVRLYVLPLQIHPLHSLWRYGSPGSFVKLVWRGQGPFLTLGMPQDTTALEDGWITDEQFLALCQTILRGRRHVLAAQLAGFREGVLASVFDSLDRVQHMFWRTRPDIVEGWYVQLDELVGEVEGQLQRHGQARVKTLIVSDHGIARYDHKVHLNRWLEEHGYLVKQAADGPDELKNVDWARTQAYAIGLNSLYLNLAGREGRGVVPPDQAQALAGRLRNDLLAWQGPDGRPVVGATWRRDECLMGSLAPYGPDVVVGYSPGYRGSPETGLGAWKQAAIEPNGDHWGADHCIDHRAVPGVLFCNRGLEGFGQPSYRDIPAIAIGATPTHRDAAPPSGLSGEDEKTIDERLKSLGYL